MKEQEVPDNIERSALKKEGRRKLSEDPVFQKLLGLGLPEKDFAVFGSGPMWAHGLKELDNDLDIIARGEAWEKAKGLAGLEKTKSGKGEAVVLFDGKIEIFDTWAPGEWNIDELIDTAQVFEGVKFVTLENVLKWKRELNRKKDHGHIKLIEDHLSPPDPK